MTVGTNRKSGESPSEPASLCAVAATASEGVAGSSLATVGVAVCGPGAAGVKVTSNGKQAPGPIATGKPPDGAVALNWGLLEEMEFTVLLTAPVLQTVRVERPTPPSQTLPITTLDGT